MKLAITGGTGFVGARLLDAAIAAGHSVLALTRRPQEPRSSLQWVSGSLSDPESLEALVADADAVIHVAGVLKARDAAGFDAANAAGTLAMLAAATAGGVRRFVLVSSLAAREPKTSMYGASKAKAEELVEESGLDWVIVRPPAVYGPGDRETLELFKMAKRRLLVLPPAGRLSLIHVDDLVRLLLACAEPGAPSQLLLEPDDGRPGGWTHKQFGQALGQAVDRRVLSLSVSPRVLRSAAVLDHLFRRDRAKLTLDRASYFCHPDWVAAPAKAPPRDLWRPQIDTPAGLKDTAEWYRRQGWL